MSSITIVVGIVGLAVGWALREILADEPFDPLRPDEVSEGDRAASLAGFVAGYGVGAQHAHNGHAYRNEADQHRIARHWYAGTQERASQ